MPTMCIKPKVRTFRTLVIGSSTIILDLKIFKKKVREKDLGDGKYKWG